MSDRQVPCEPGRRVLIRPCGQWLEAVGVADGHIAPNGDKWRAGWVVVSRAGTSTATTWYPPGAGPTAPLPDECPRCGWLGCHEEGCMVAANLARGVPAFWAPFAMWTHPAPGCEYVQLHRIVGDGMVSETVIIMKWMTTGRDVFFVALGPNGPTLSPWGKP